jgi:glutathione S-transferase
VFFPNVIELIQEVFYKPDPATRDEKRVAAAIERLGVVYRRLEGELAGREFLCGAFGVADIAWFLSIGFATSLGAPPDPSLKAIAGWLARVAERPSVRREQEGMRAAILALSEPSRAA